MEKKQVYEEVRKGATIRCRTCGNTERFTMWRPIAEYYVESERFEDCYMPETDELRCDDCGSKDVEELPMGVNQ